MTASAETIVEQAEPVGLRLDPPAHKKIGMLIALGGVSGFGLGVYATWYGGVFWQLLLVLALGCLALWQVSQRWVTAPIEKLADQAQRLSRTGQNNTLKSLPVGKSDEVGRIAQALYDLGVSSRQGYLQTQALKRSIDHKVATATSRATRELKQIANQDVLTDLGNRRSLDEVKQQVFERAKAKGGDLSCVMIDLDSFKLINDSLGHEAGDHLLVFLGRLINAVKRDEDVAVRLGGDEFVILMPDTDAVQAGELAELIGKHFTYQSHTMMPKHRMLGVSYGIASIKADACKDARALMRLADERLYNSKGSAQR